jgi:hypothetical protein
MNQDDNPFEMVPNQNLWQPVGQQPVAPQEHFVLNNNHLQYPFMHYPVAHQDPNVIVSPYYPNFPVKPVAPTMPVVQGSRPCYQAEIINGKYRCPICKMEENGSYRIITHAYYCTNKGLQYCQSTNNRLGGKRKSRKNKKRRNSKRKSSRR